METDKKPYMYPIDQCQVRNKPLLEEFRKKRFEWLAWLEADPVHNIWGQIHEIMWSDAAYRSLNEARRFSQPDRPTAAGNGLIREFIDRGYVANQVLDICKLTDGGDDVVSLRRLLGDLKRHRTLITRENFVAYDGLPYDYTAAEEAYIATLTREQLLKPHWRSTTGPHGSDLSRRLHTAFDRLSGVLPEARTPDDLIHENVFTTIESWLSSSVLNKLRTYRNKYVGHAADEKSRKNSPLEHLGFSLDDFAEAQKIVIRIATTIGSEVLYESALGGVVPTPQFDVFKNLELAMIPESEKEAMSDWWYGHSKDREEWLQERIDLITGEITHI